MRGFFRRGSGQLALAGLSSALIYAAIVLRIPLLRTYTIPLLNLNNIPRSDWLTGALVIGCAVILFGAYLLGALCVMQSRPGRRTTALVAVLALGFVALLLFAHPMTSTDVYDYLFRGRMLTHYEANPFVTIPWQYNADPLIKYVAWKLVPTAYGPLWESMSWVAARLAGQAPGTLAAPPLAQMLGLIFAYKALAALGFLLCGAAIWLALGRAAPHQRLLGLYLWLWNPLALWETVGAVHNDVWMALFIVLALWAFQARRPLQDARSESPAMAHDRPDMAHDRLIMTHDRPDMAHDRPDMVHDRPDMGHDRPDMGHDRLIMTHDRQVAGRGSSAADLRSPVLALLALTAGGLIKYVAFFFGPLTLAAALRRLPTWRARLRLLILGGLACAALFALAYAPFWDGWATLQNVRDRRTFYTASWLAALQAALQPGFSQEQAQTIIAATSLALLFAGVVWSTWRAWRAPDKLAGHMLWLALWFLFVCNPWFQPWYVIWPLALVAVQPWRTRAVVGVGVFCVTAIVSYIVGGLLLPLLGLADKSIGREGLMAAWIYLPPLLVLGWGHLARVLRALRRVPKAVAARRYRDPERPGQLNTP